MTIVSCIEVVCKTFFLKTFYKQSFTLYTSFPLNSNAVITPNKISSLTTPNSTCATNV